MNYIRRLLILVILLSQGCRNNELHSMHSDLAPFVDAFSREASARGIPLHRKHVDVIVKFGRVEGHHHASCKPGAVPAITIDSVAWKFINAAQREFLVFHELSHCLLRRSHHNDVFPFGECRSWMRARDSTCYANLHNPEWRKYYLDELFNPDGVGIPSWYRFQPPLPETSRITPAHDIDIPPFRFIYFDSLLSDPNDWVIEMIVSEPPSGNSSFGLRINELDVETLFPSAGRAQRRPVMVIMANDPRRIVSSVVSPTPSMKLSIQKAGNTVFFYFGNALRYRYPVGNGNLRVGAYCSFPQGNYSLRFYRL